MRSLAPNTFRTAGPAERARLTVPSTADLLKSRRDIFKPSIMTSSRACIERSRAHNLCALSTTQAIDDPLNAAASHPLPDAAGSTDPERAIAFCHPGLLLE